MLLVFVAKRLARTRINATMTVVSIENLAWTCVSLRKSYSEMKLVDALTCKMTSSFSEALKSRGSTEDCQNAGPATVKIKGVRGFCP